MRADESGLVKFVEVKPVLHRGGETAQLGRQRIGRRILIECQRGEKPANGNRSQTGKQGRRVNANGSRIRLDERQRREPLPVNCDA